MDPRYWPLQGYTNPNGQFVQYPPPQSSQPSDVYPQNGYAQHEYQQVAFQQSVYQQNVYQQQGHTQQLPPIQMHMQSTQNYRQIPQYKSPPHAAFPRPSTQQYSSISPQTYDLPLPQPLPQPILQPQPQPQVTNPPRAPNMALPMQMSAPKIRHVQVPVHRAGATIPQMDGTGHQPRQFNSQQGSASPAVKPAQSQSSQENRPNPQQRIAQPPLQNQTQYRAPLQPQVTPQQRKFSAVQVPLSQQKDSSAQHIPPQRTPTHQSPSQVTPSKPKLHPQVVIVKPVSHQLTPRKHVQTPKSLPADLPVMLLSAADEYIAAAHRMGFLIMRDKSKSDLERYYKLMATAMGCMDAVLKDFTMLPRDEAKLRLRYATLLVEETENTTDIDGIISKQLSLCGRCRLHDLKYATLHLQARYQFKTNHRAALKVLDKPISETETFEHIPWVYAFRFLKVSLMLQIPGRIEAVPALQQLHAILAHAERKQDKAIFVACSALEAIVHLRSGDRLEQAQRAIAAARSLQLQVSDKQSGAFGALIDLVDVACGVQYGMPNNQKSTALIQSMLDESRKADSENGVFAVLLERSFGGNLTIDTGGVFRKAMDGRDELVFAWLPLDDLRALCFHICALDQNIHEKGLSYAKEAHQRSQGALKRQTWYSVPMSVGIKQTNWNKMLDWNAMFTIGLIACFREDQALANDALTILNKRIARPPYNNQDTFMQTLSYLSAMKNQMGGLLDASLLTYSSDILALPEKATSTSAKTDITILAALNRLLILRSPSHPQHYTAAELLSRLQLFCENHPNQYMRMAFRLVHAISSDDAAINRQKSLTQAASNRANEIFRNTQNREFVIIALCYFTMRFFADQVGEKSIQAIRATRHNAKPSRRPIWMAVALGLCITTYQRNGLFEEAQKAQSEFESIRLQLPAALQEGPNASTRMKQDVIGEDEQI